MNSLNKTTFKSIVNNSNSRNNLKLELFDYRKNNNNRNRNLIKLTKKNYMKTCKQIYSPNTISHSPKILKNETKILNISKNIQQNSNDNIKIKNENPINLKQTNRNIQSVHTLKTPRGNLQKEDSEKTLNIPIIKSNGMWNSSKINHTIQKLLNNDKKIILKSKKNKENIQSSKMNNRSEDKNNYFFNMEIKNRSTKTNKNKNFILNDRNSIFILKKEINNNSNIKLYKKNNLVKSLIDTSSLDFKTIDKNKDFTRKSKSKSKRNSKSKSKFKSKPK